MGFIEGMHSGGDVKHKVHQFLAAFPHTHALMATPPPTGLLSYYKSYLEDIVSSTDNNSSSSSSSSSMRRNRGQGSSSRRSSSSSSSSSDEESDRPSKFLFNRLWQKPLAQGAFVAAAASKGAAALWKYHIDYFTMYLRSSRDRWPLVKEDNMVTWLTQLLLNLVRLVHPEPNSAEEIRAGLKLILTGLLADVQKWGGEQGEAGEAAAAGGSTGRGSGGCKSSSESGGGGGGSSGSGGNSSSGSSNNSSGGRSSSSGGCGCGNGSGGGVECDGVERDCVKGQFLRDTTKGKGKQEQLGGRQGSSRAFETDKDGSPNGTLHCPAAAAAAAAADLAPTGTVTVDGISEEKSSHRSCSLPSASTAATAGTAPGDAADNSAEAATASTAATAATATSNVPDDGVKAAAADVQNPTANHSTSKSSSSSNGEEKSTDEWQRKRAIHEQNVRRLCALIPLEVRVIFGGVILGTHLSLDAAALVWRFLVEAEQSGGPAWEEDVPLQVVLMMQEAQGMQYSAEMLAQLLITDINMGGEQALVSKIGMEKLAAARGAAGAGGGGGGSCCSGKGREGGVEGSQGGQQDKKEQQQQQQEKKEQQQQQQEKKEQQQQQQDNKQQQQQQQQQEAANQNGVGEAGSSTAAAVGGEGRAPGAVAGAIDADFFRRHFKLRYAQDIGDMEMEAMHKKVMLMAALVSFAMAVVECFLYCRLEQRVTFHRRN